MVPGDTRLNLIRKTEGSSFHSAVFCDWCCRHSSPQDSIFHFFINQSPVLPNTFCYDFLALLPQECFSSKTKLGQPGLLREPPHPETSPTWSRITGWWSQFLQSFWPCFAPWLPEPLAIQPAWCLTAVTFLCTTINLGSWFFTSFLTLVSCRLKYSGNPYLSCSQEF